MSYMERFLSDIQRMNATYELPYVGDNDDARWDRAGKFQDILKEELSEVDELGDTAEVMRVNMADLLADIIVYCASEALRWKIPIDEVLEVVMMSNFSKLGEDGRPIKDSRGKFLKGPNYWPPEKMISQILEMTDE